MSLPDAWPWCWVDEWVARCFLMGECDPITEAALVNRMRRFGRMPGKALLN